MVCSLEISPWLTALKLSTQVAALYWSFINCSKQCFPILIMKPRLMQTCFLSLTRATLYHALEYFSCWDLVRTFPECVINTLNASSEKDLLLKILVSLLLNTQTQSVTHRDSLIKIMQIFKNDFLWLFNTGGLIKLYTVQWETEILEGFFIEIYGYLT